jgi:hypothetical protein
LQHQAAADQQHQADGDFDHHKRIAQARVARAGAPAGFVFQDIIHGGLCRSERRRQSEEDAGGQGYAAEEDEDRQAGSGRSQIRQRAELRFRYRCNEQIDTPLGTQEAYGCAKDGQEKTLRQQLRDEVRTCRAQSGSHREFFAAADGTGQQQIRDVGARNQQNKPDRAQQHQ